ncbi:sigma-70 family RNA polymerase sigma factor [Paracoccus sp. MC1854]|uniref:sigma-70 family RNA polymerase sigma factor n=1 Tax=Paracoccus sp. MC1854 TaxID=2760306 RepID=UPI0016014E0B|nr:sigma-70 family RNA polymerase sigma factor [Paracoccus sp. MC1854]MBB1493226.1 sigma-70 family RNA polymerase sigma factor [Paracoccus sp. MC1854]
MSFSWPGIREGLARTSTTFQFHQCFRALRRREDVLRSFRDQAALLDALNRTSGDPEHKNRILTALVRSAQRDGPEADCALTLLLLALWPGLDAVMRRARVRRLGTPDELASEILARATEAARSLDLQRVSRIAATLVMNIERDLGRAMRRESDRQHLHGEVDPDWIVAAPSWAAQGQMRTELHGDLTTLIGRDTDLVLGSALDGFSQLEMAQRLGVGEAAARKRYQRATARITQDI